MQFDYTIGYAVVYAICNAVGKADGSAVVYAVGYDIANCVGSSLVYLFVYGIGVSSSFVMGLIICDDSVVSHDREEFISWQWKPWCRSP